MVESLLHSEWCYIHKYLLVNRMKWYDKFYFISYNRGTFHGQALRTLHGDPNLGVLTTPRQPTPSKFKVSSVTTFEPKTMCHLLGLHFLVFALTNWATLAGDRFINNSTNPIAIS